VVRGKNVPRARLHEVAEHYLRFGGRSPLNQQNRALIAALKDEFEAHGLRLPIYFGNRNWMPYLVDALRQIKADDTGPTLALFTSVFSCYSACRQYRENIEAARAEIGDQAPEVHKVRAFFNHPGFVEVMADRVRAALGQIPPEHRDHAELVFCTHSIPLAMAQHSPYEQQFAEASRLVAQAVEHPNWHLAYQSRSGPPRQPWLEPDVCEKLDEIQAGETNHVVVVPIGFLSDHIEVLYDLDTEAKQHAEAIGLGMVRAGTAGTHPRFVRMIRELVVERIESRLERPVVGKLESCWDVCPPNCCLPQ
jgi:ferrochelatase